MPRIKRTCPDLSRPVLSVVEEAMSRERSRRKSGGQPGNQNAKKHGFYSKTLTPAEQADLQHYGLDGLDREIAILRSKIASIMAISPENIRVLKTALSSLEHLLVEKRTLTLPDEFLLDNVRDALQAIAESKQSLPEAPPHIKKARFSRFRK